MKRIITVGLGGSYCIPSNRLAGVDESTTDKIAPSLPAVVITKGTLIPLGFVLAIGLIGIRVAFEAGSTSNDISSKLNAITAENIKVAKAIDHLANNEDHQGSDINDIKINLSLLTARVASLEHEFDMTDDKVKRK